MLIIELREFTLKNICKFGIKIQVMKMKVILQ